MRLSEKITFQRKASPDQIAPDDGTDPFGNPIDGYGNSTGEFADHLTVWADFNEETGGEKLAAGVLESTARAVVKVRYWKSTAEIVSADRIVARGRVWNIRSIIHFGKTKRFIEFVCESGVAT